MSQRGVGPGDSDAAHRRGPGEVGSSVGATHLEVTGLVAGYVRGLPVVHGVSISVARREIVTLIGPNGAGKSTLLKAIAGLIACEAGGVRIDGRDVTAVPADRGVSEGSRLGRHAGQTLP